MAKNSIGMAIACEEYGAMSGGILEHPGTVKNPERVRESWTSAFLSSEKVKAKTGNTTDATVYNDWYKAVYMPTVTETDESEA